MWAHQSFPISWRRKTKASGLNSLQELVAIPLLPPAAACLESSLAHWPPGSLVEAARTVFMEPTGSLPPEYSPPHAHRLPLPSAKSWLTSQPLSEPRPAAAESHQRRPLVPTAAADVQSTYLWLLLLFSLHPRVRASWGHGVLSAWFTQVSQVSRIMPVGGRHPISVCWLSTWGMS